jgi:hypothetical protein
VLSDLNRKEVQDEGSLLIEAVSLLVQRQHETESWIADQIWQAEERATATERLYEEFEARLAGIEEHLARLVHDVEPLRGDAGVDERLERLREQVEGLKAGPDGRPARPGPVLAAAAGAGPSAVGEAPGREPDAVSVARSGRPVVVRDARATDERRPLSVGPAAGPRHRPAPSAGPGVSFWELLGPSPQDRFGLLLIGAGAVAVLYAVLTQLRFG